MLGLSVKVQPLWNAIIEKVEKKLAGWKKLHLSEEERSLLSKVHYLDYQCIFFKILPGLFKLLID